jgi:hypothetical protein
MLNDVDNLIYKVYNLGIRLSFTLNVPLQYVHETFLRY